MSFKKLFAILFLSGALSLRSFGEEPPSHAPKAKDEHALKEEAHHKEHTEGEKDEHAEGGGHGDEHEKEGGHEEGGAAIGPDKGIMEKGPLGIKLSPEAIKTINTTTVAWSSESFSIPYKALVRIKETKSIFRLRNGFYKRVPVKVSSRQGDSVSVRAEGLQAGDQIVVSNVGFLRIAEVITEEGAAHSH